MVAEVAERLSFLKWSLAPGTFPGPALRLAPVRDRRMNTSQLVIRDVLRENVRDTAGALGTCGRTALALRRELTRAFLEAFRV